MYTFLTEPPKTGQFIQIWTHRNSVWSDTFYWHKDYGLQVYCAAEDSWESIDESALDNNNRTFVKYIVLGED